MKDIKELLKEGESLNLEFKTCRNALNRDVYETVCAFLNRHGGTLLLGVNDQAEVTGIDPDAITQLKKDFANNINNPQKLNPPAYLSVEEQKLDNKKLLRIFVPESSQVHRCNGRIYDRNEDGDMDITDHTAQVAQLYLRKQSSYSENKIYAHIQVEDLRKDLIDRCRRIAQNQTGNHPWSEMDDLQLLTSAQLYQTDAQSGQKGVTLAGVMLLAPDQLILNVCPAHRTDLILRKVNTDRYDDRDLVRTNLIDSYDRILAFIQKHLPDPFHLEGTDRISLRDVIFREVASNMLIHREYVSGAPARLIIEYGKVCTENPNRPHGFGTLNPATFAPFPKNPVIGAFFREINRADELGSGMRKMQQFGKLYGGADPQLIEGDLFHMIISIPEFADQQAMETKASQPKGQPSGKTSGNNSGPISGQIGGQSNLTKRQQEILAILKAAPSTSRKQMASQLGINPSAIQKHLNTLKEKGILQRIGTAKGGHWEISKQQPVDPNARQPNPKVSEKTSGQVSGKISGQIGGLISGQIGGQSNLTKRQQEILAILNAAPSTSRKQMASQLGINPSAIQKHLNTLKENGILKRTGGTRGHWEIRGDLET